LHARIGVIDKALECCESLFESILMKEKLGITEIIKLSETEFSKEVVKDFKLY
jgi:hypothetical protein